MSPKKNTSNVVAATNEANSSTPEKEAETTPIVTKPRVIRKPLLKHLRFDLSQADIVGKAESAAKGTRAVAEVEAEFARVKDDYKGRIQKLEQQIHQDLRCVEDRSEYREVLCDEVHDFEQALVRYDYDGKTYEQREMSPRERQMSIEVMQ